MPARLALPRRCLEWRVLARKSPKCRGRLLGEELEVTSNNKGRYMIDLPPCTYDVHVDASGFAAKTEILEASPLTEPIWLERRKRTRQQPINEDDVESLYSISSRSS